MNTSRKDELCAIIVQHLISGGCQTTNAPLCASILAILLLPPEYSELADLKLFVIDTIINLPSKKTLHHALCAIDIPHTSTNSINTLQSLLGQHHDTFIMNGQLQLQHNRCTKSKPNIGATFRDVANDWPQRITHVDKAQIVCDFWTATSSDGLKSVVCASRTESVCAWVSQTYLSLIQ